jgi:hypothetical protein
MKKKIVCSITVALFLLLLTIMAASAVTPRVPGVHSGDQFVYAPSLSWYSNDSSATVPWNFQNLNDTEWLMVTITNVQFTNVTGQMTQHYKNGTEQLGAGYVDVATGIGENLTMFVIATNLNANDSIYTTGFYTSWIINETVPVVYSGIPRLANHFNVTATYSLGNTTLNQTENIYWDRSTGVITNISIDFSNQTEPYLTTMNYGIQITASSVWVVPEYPSFFILPLLMAITLPAVIVYKRKRTKPSIT